MRISLSVLQLCFKALVAETRQFSLLCSWWLREQQRRAKKGRWSYWRPRVFSLVLAPHSAAKTLSAVGLHVQRITGLRMEEIRPIELNFFWSSSHIRSVPSLMESSGLRGQFIITSPQSWLSHVCCTSFVKALWAEGELSLSPLTWSISSVLSHSHLFYCSILTFYCLFLITIRAECAISGFINSPFQMYTFILFYFEGL